MAGPYPGARAQLWVCLICHISTCSHGVVQIWACLELADIPAIITGSRAKSLLSPGLQGTYQTFWPRPLHVIQKFLFVSPFSCLINGVSKFCPVPFPASPLLTSDCYTPAGDDCEMNSKTFFYVAEMRFSKKAISKQVFHGIP